MSLCRYRNVFGAPGEGAHSHRFLGFATVDLALTVVAAAIFTVCFDRKLRTFALAFVALMVAGIVLHRVFCVNTRLNVDIFGHL